MARTLGRIGHRMWPEVTEPRRLRVRPWELARSSQYDAGRTFV